MAGGCAFTRRSSLLQTIALTPGPDGTVYAIHRLNDLTMLTAIKGTAALADSPWPMIGGNTHNTISPPTAPRLAGISYSDTDISIVLPTKVGHTHHIDYKTSLERTKLDSPRLCCGRRQSADS